MSNCERISGVLSAAVGRAEGGRTVGVAPAAQWVACEGLPDGRYSNVSFTACADWLVTTAQPDIIVNPWQLPTLGCDSSVYRIVAIWRLAEMLPIFAAGNNGPQSSSDRSPGNFGFSVGAMSKRGTILERSSRGPNSCTGSIFPSIVAPGAAVPVAFPLTSSSYIKTEGTSVAAGITAGVAALLLQRDPDASVAELETALRNGAVDMGQRGPDNSSGYGRLSVPGALAALERIRAKLTATSNIVLTPHR